MLRGLPFTKETGLWLGHLTSSSGSSCPASWTSASWVISGPSWFTLSSSNDAGTSDAPNACTISEECVHTRWWWMCWHRFLDTYPGSVECGSARKGNSDWSVGKLPIRVDADEEAAGCGWVHRWWCRWPVLIVIDGEFADDVEGRLRSCQLVHGGVLAYHDRIVLCFP